MILFCFAQSTRFLRLTDDTVLLLSANAAYCRSNLESSNTGVRSRVGERKRERGLVSVCVWERVGLGVTTTSTTVPFSFQDMCAVWQMGEREREREKERKREPICVPTVVRKKERKRVSEWEGKGIGRKPWMSHRKKKSTKLHQSCSYTINVSFSP